MLPWSNLWLVAAAISHRITWAVTGRRQTKIRTTEQKTKNRHMTDVLRGRYVDDTLAIGEKSAIGVSRSTLP